MTRPPLVAPLGRAWAAAEVAREDGGAFAGAFAAAACFAGDGALGASTFVVDGRLEEIVAVDIRALQSLLRGKAPDMGDVGR